MPCCGHQRVKAVPGTTVRLLPERAPKPVWHAQAFFQYLGTTGLTVVGMATGTHYRFDSPGAIVAVDPRDRPSLRPIPHLRQVHLP